MLREPAFAAGVLHDGANDFLESVDSYHLILISESGIPGETFTENYSISYYHQLIDYIPPAYPGIPIPTYSAQTRFIISTSTISWKSSFTRQTGAVPQDARHSANSTETLPQGEMEIG